MATRKRKKSSSSSDSFVSVLFCKVMPKVLLFTFVAYATTMIVINQVKINRLEASTKALDESIAVENINKNQLTAELDEFSNEGEKDRIIRKEADAAGIDSPL